MRKWKWLIAVLMAGTGGPIGPPPTAAQTAPVPVALSGTAAPAGGNYSDFSFPALNESGQVAFQANLSGGSSSQGIFVGVPGMVQAAALTNTAAPAGGTYTSLNGPKLNGSGQVAFYANLNGDTLPSGAFVGAPGAIQAAALINTASPAGGNYSFFANQPLLNDSGQVAFQANVGSSSRGIFAGGPGAVQAVALQGAPAPAGGNYNIVFNIGPTGLNGSGQAAFRSLVGSGSTQGIFVGAPGAVQAAALSGDAAPAGGNYASNGLGLPRLNGSGQVAFTASLTGGSSTSGVFVGAPGAIQAAALQGSAAPAGGTYSDFPGTFVALNGSGQVAFQANLTGGSSSQGIFVGASGAVQAAALQGAPAPGGGVFNTFNDPTLNGSGQVAFTATLTGAGVTTANDAGLYAGSVGALLKIVREGDVVNVAPGAGLDLRTVADGGIGFLNGVAGAFSDSRFVSYRLTFTDGSSGVFVSSIIPVPEPALAGLVAAAGAAAAGLIRRLGRRAAPPSAPKGVEG